MWVPPEQGNQYVRKLERRLRRESEELRARGGQPNAFFQSNLTIHRGLLAFGGAILILIAALVFLSGMTSNFDLPLR